MHKKNINHILNPANGMTMLRIVGTGCLLFLRPASVEFYGVYTVTGLTDMLDGWIARKTGTAGEFGARLDSISDLLFYAVMLLQVFPILWQTLPVSLWYGVAAVLLLRACAYLTAAIRFRRFASLHTYLNKATGGAVFLIPYLLHTPYLVPYSWVVCGLGAAASAEELALHLSASAYRPDTKTIFHKESCLPRQQHHKKKI